MTTAAGRLAAWDRLAAELDADRFDSPAAREAMRELGVLGLLVRAWIRTKRRELAAARTDLDTALRATDDAPQVQLIAGVLGALVREPGVALERLRAAERDPRFAARALRFELQLTRRLGWCGLAREIAERALETAPPLHRDAHRELAQRYARVALFDEALRAAEAALPEAPSVGERLDHARLLVRSGRFDAARAIVEPALRQPGIDDADRIDAAEILVTAGAIDAAVDLLHRILAHDPANVRVLARLAELRLWQDADDDAATLACRVLAIVPAHAGALRTLGIRAFRRDRFVEALGWFDRAVAADPGDPETRVWRARVRLQLDPSALLQLPDSAYEHTDPDLAEASALSHGFYLAAELVRCRHEVSRMLHADSRGAGPRGLPRQFVEPVLAFLRLIDSDAGAILTSQHGEAQRALLGRGLDALGANLSRVTTLRRDGRLERVHATFVREEARQALETIMVCAPAEVHARLEQVVARYPESSLPLCYLGELYVWLGDVAEARRWLQRAIDHTPTTRWAYIGLGACALLEADWTGALDVLALGVERMGNTTGPAVYPARAEALRHLARFDEARADLQRAVETAPDRLATWINLGLLDAAVGDDAALAGAFARVRRRAAGLMADAARELGEVAWCDDDAPPPAAVQRRLLEHMLHMLRGNRASGLITYVRRDGALRVLVTEGHDLARDDARDLRDAWMLLQRLSPAAAARR